MKKQTCSLVSVTMITHNRMGDVRESLEQVKKILYPNWEMIVVDNASTDGVIAMLENEYSWIKLIKLAENRPLYARGLCFVNARGKYVVNLDDDSYPEPEAISIMVERFEADPCLGMIAFNIPCGDYFTTEFWYETSANMRGMFIGCGAGFRKEVFERIGSYWADELTQTYADEYDFTYRAYAAGYTLGHFKNIIAHHRPRRSAGRVRRFFYNNARNHNYLIGKFLPMRYWSPAFIRPLFYMLLWAYYSEGIRAAWWTILGNIAGVGYMLKGHEKRIKMPPAVVSSICYSRYHWCLPLWKFFLIKKDREKVILQAKYKNYDHSFCPRRQQTEKEIDKDLLRKPLNAYSKLLWVNILRFGFGKLRKNNEERREVYKFILSELDDLKINISHNSEDQIKYSTAITQLRSEVKDALGAVLA